MTSDEQRRLRRLLRDRRWMALGTVRDGAPYVSWVAGVAEDDLAGFLLHLSGLALHTRHLADDPRASLSMSEPDCNPQTDPQQLARVSLQGRVLRLARETGDYGVARTYYLHHLPQAAPQFELGDFELYRFVPEAGRYISGFGGIHRIGLPELRAVVALDESV